MRIFNYYVVYLLSRYIFILVDFSAYCSMKYYLSLVYVILLSSQVEERQTPNIQIHSREL